MPVFDSRIDVWHSDIESFRSKVYSNVHEIGVSKPNAILTIGSLSLNILNPVARGKPMFVGREVLYRFASL